MEWVWYNLLMGNLFKRYRIWFAFSQKLVAELATNEYPASSFLKKPERFQSAQYIWTKTKCRCLTVRLTVQFVIWNAWTSGPRLIELALTKVRNRELTLNTWQWISKNFMHINSSKEACCNWKRQKGALGVVLCFNCGWRYRFGVEPNPMRQWRALRRSGS